MNQTLNESQKSDILQLQQMLLEYTSENTDHDSIFLRSILHQTVMILLCRERQYFSNDYARWLYAADMFKISKSGASLILQLLQILKNKSNSKFPQTLSFEYIRARYSQLLDDICSDTETISLGNEQNTENENLRLFDESNRTTTLLRGVSLQTPLVEYNTITLVLDCDGVQCSVALDKHFLYLETIVVPGRTIHVCNILRKENNTSYISTKETLCTVEPDVMYDVTDIASCFSSASGNPYLYFAKQFIKRDSTSTALLLGNIANSCFDEILSGKTNSTDKIIRNVLLYKPLNTAAILYDSDSQADLQRIENETAFFLEKTTKDKEMLSLGTCTLEPTFLSPVFGLQGRLDAMFEYDFDSSKKDVVELKSGKFPKTTNSGLYANNAMWHEHAAQIGCYNLLLDSAYPGRTGSSRVYYVRDEENPTRNLPNEPLIKRNILRVRNIILSFELEIANRTFNKVFKNLFHENNIASLRFERDEVMRLKNIYYSISETERIYYHAWISFIMNENLTARTGGDNDMEFTGFSALWQLSVKEKRNSDSIICDAILDVENTDWDTFHLAFRRTVFNTSTKLRIGDMIIVHASTESDAVSYSAVRRPLLRGSIRKLSEVSIVISLRNKFLRVKTFLELQSAHWIIEPDYLESTSRAALQILPEILALPEKKRRVMLGFSAPEFEVIHNDLLDKLSNNYPQLSDEQKEIAANAISAKDYYLIQGPPGTGKTSYVIKSIIGLLHSTLENTILIMAYTNRAVDEICKSVLVVVPESDILRLGSPESTEYPALTPYSLSQNIKLTELPKLFKQKRVVIGTVAGLLSNIDVFSLFNFSHCVVDEAGQILEPYIVGIISKIPRIILVGDEKQLPAIVQQRQELCTVNHSGAKKIYLDDLRRSYFERMLRCCQANGWNNAFGMLTVQGRMHNDIAKIPSDLFYEGKLQCRAEWQYSNQMDMYRRQSILPYKLAEKQLVYIPTLFESHRKFHRGEAAITAELCALIIANLKYDCTEQTIGIISPFRAQISEIQLQLHKIPSLEPYIQYIAVDTVERFQGSERDIIIFSFALNYYNMIETASATAQFNGVAVDRKINVAITRARKQLIVLGNWDVLSKSEIYRSIIEKMM